MIKFKKLLSLTAAITSVSVLCGSVCAIPAIVNYDNTTSSEETPPISSSDTFSYDDTTDTSPGIIILDPYDTQTSDTEPTQTPPESDTQETPPDTQDTPDPVTSEPPVDTSEDTGDTSDTLDVQTEPPLEIFLEQYTFYLETGQGAQLLWSVPAATEHRDAVYYSNNTNIARIDNWGYITAVGAGVTNVTVIWGDLLTVSATVHVTERQVLPEYISLNSESFTMKVGETAAIKASVMPEEISDDYPLSFSSDNEAIAAVDENGIITAIGTGETDITVFSNAANLSELVHITVSDDIAYSQAKLDGYLYGEDGKPMAGITLLIDSESAVTDKNGYFAFDRMNCRELIIRMSDNPNSFCGFALTGNMTVYLLSTGAGISQLSTYEELALHLSINNVSFVSPKLVLTVGEVYELAYNYDPKDATVTAIEYESSNERVAPVGQIDGVVTAKSPGEAVITLSLNGGQTMTTCTITINPKESSEHSALIAAAETTVLAIAVIAFFTIYRLYRKKMERKLSEEEDEDGAGNIHDID